jgi:hypothetical protein
MRQSEPFGARGQGAWIVRALALAGALALAACSSDGGVVGSEWESTAPGRGGDGGATAPSTMNGGGGDSSIGGSTEPDPTLSEPNRPHPFDHVTDRNYTAMLIEVDYVSSAPPGDAALVEIQEQVVRFIDGGYLSKPDGVRLVVDDVLTPLGSDAVSTFDDLDALVREVRSVPSDPSESVVHIVYVDGGFEQDTDTATVLGFAYGAANVVIFRDSIRAACESGSLRLLPGGADAAEEACQVTEATVLMHELGHVFGLVNNGVPLQSDHQDEEHGAHCDNPECLMYYAAERSSVVSRIAGRFEAGQTNVPRFDEACLQDLAAAAGG